MNNEIKKKFTDQHTIAVLRQENKNLKYLLKKVTPILSRAPFDLLNDEEKKLCNKLYKMFYAAKIDNMKQEE